MLHSLTNIQFNEIKLKTFYFVIKVLILGDWSEWQFGADLPGPKVRGDI